MFEKAIIMLGFIIGSTIGSFVPALWGASMLSFSSIIGSAVGGLIGIYIGYKISF